ncbi:hypothetical protein QO010_001477 [Caulobacter ginsengisoli]|uniref:Phenylacetic acid degradation protein PaaB n=1 Tax=Caulobacter ginsengisoli TaxID=400775 RepID=A0ABU0INX7_9CAUL|nr:hypothetical protein [Caulobacter ginsengisoli]MDQ0463706.1 hypothetical protein [Caulobacter ginsengisoli]
MQDYVFHVHYLDRPEPEVLAVVVRDDQRAHELARQRLAEGHAAIEVWSRERRLFRVSREGGQKDAQSA